MGSGLSGLNVASTFLDRAVIGSPAWEYRWRKPFFHTGYPDRRGTGQTQHGSSSESIVALDPESMS